MKTTIKTIGDAIAAQMRSLEYAKLIMTKDNDGNETAVIYDYNQVIIIQDVGTMIKHTLLDANEIEALKAILK
jgi:hypothetical protein